MTFVAARRIGDRIVLAADTMISHPQQVRANGIPGWLKIVILDPTMTIAYAGYTDQEIDAIRLAAAARRRGAAPATIEGLLAEETARYAGDLEFLIATHGEGVTLKRIWDGRVSAPLDQTSIGERDLFARLLDSERRQPCDPIPHEFESETRFLRAFSDLFDGVHVAEGVGGLNVFAACSPHGHHYAPWVGITAWDEMRGGEPLSVEQIADRRSGRTQWRYAIFAPRLRGVGVMGALVADAGVGLVYAPITDDDPVVWRFSPPATPTDDVAIQQEFQARIDACADRVGGGIEVAVEAPAAIALSAAEVAEMNRLAAAAALPTSLSRQENGFMLACSADGESERIFVDDAALGNDPVGVMAVAIDRINARIAPRAASARVWRAGQSDV